MRWGGWGRTRGGTTGSKGHKLVLFARLILAFVKVFSRARRDFETSPIDLGGTSLTKMALEYVLQIGMLIKNS